MRRFVIWTLLILSLGGGRPVAAAALGWRGILLGEWRGREFVVTTSVLTETLRWVKYAQRWQQNDIYTLLPADEPTRQHRLQQELAAMDFVRNELIKRRTTLSAMAEAAENTASQATAQQEATRAEMNAHLDALAAPDLEVNFQKYAAVSPQSARGQIEAEACRRVMALVDWVTADLETKRAEYETNRAAIEKNVVCPQ